MFLSADLTVAIQKVLRNLHSCDVSIISVKQVAGGSINHCYQVESTVRIYFLKTNSAIAFPDIFLAEAEGLNRIRQTQTVAVPDVVAHGKAGDETFLILNWINSDNGDSDQYLLGKQLAKMHTHSTARFGLDHDNYMGSLRQSNAWTTTWPEFFANERLEPQLKISYDKNLISTVVKNQFELLLTKLQALYIQEIPSLVHGDLWSGNCIMEDSGKPFVIDPAVYYGNREVDIAMSTLFGGFTSEFYIGYNDEFPLLEGWKERLDIWNLYPLLVHLNLFGRAYLGQIESILKRFI